MEMEMEERECRWFERKRFKASMGSVTIGNGRSVLRVTPHPPFIAFPRGFRVLIPWSRL